MSNFERYGRINAAGVLNGSPAMKIFSFDGTKKELLAGKWDSLINFGGCVMAIRCSDSKAALYEVHDNGSVEGL
ncbi:hypothetical protein [Vibrio variabilis]|uniref:hypothetical protein n=1 Tax=Vibrio variabilis TaxID=990271 RepID=UPI000DDAEE10|nr:hypothetical protein [Vibrio variabilis]